MKKQCFLLFAMIGPLLMNCASKLIGAEAGVIIGGLVGASLDNDEQKELKRENKKTYDRVDKNEQLSVQDIISLHKTGISEAKIIDLIKKTNSHYTLDRYQMNVMRDAGVSEKVIYYMMYST